MDSNFWAIEVLPGKTFTTKPLFPLRITKAVLPPSATDSGRSVVQIKAGDKLFSIASLKLDGHDSATLDYVFWELEDELSFHITGKNPVHLTGYYEPSGADSFSDEDGDDFAFDEDDEDLLASDDGEDEEVPPQPKGKQQGKPQQHQQPAANAGQKRKPEEANGNGNAAKKSKSEEHAHKPQQQATPKEHKQEHEHKPEHKHEHKQEQPKQQTPKSEKKPQQNAGQGQQTPKNEKKQQNAGQAQQSPKSDKKKEADSSGAKSVIGVKKQLGDKLEALITKIGSGDQRAAGGDMVSVKYVGKLESGKVFDKSDSFQFRLGVGQVIQGWDKGVAGMAIGEKRTLTVPSHLAYGKEGVKGTIPSNATLVFDVELVRIGRK